MVADSKTRKTGDRQELCILAEKGDFTKRLKAVTEL